MPEQAEHRLAPPSCTRLSQSTISGYLPRRQPSAPSRIEGTITMSVDSTSSMPRFASRDRPLARRTGPWRVATISTANGARSGTDWSLPASIASEFMTSYRLVKVEIAASGIASRLTCRAGLFGAIVSSLGSFGPLLA
jgi:hypothetical protein